MRSKRGLDRSRNKKVSMPLKIKGLIFVAIMITLVILITILVALPQVRQTMSVSGAGILMNLRQEPMNMFGSRKE